MAFVEQDFGRDLALRVARDMVIYLKRPGGQSQFSVALTSQMAGTKGIRDVQTWLAAQPGTQVRLEDMAEVAGMSLRSFTRAFAAEVGQSPMAWLETLRCEQAKTLLLDTHMPLKTVAWRAGFRSDEQMRKVFARRFSVSPRDYRRRFGSAA
ncbi:GlxA family transcriptional regulator [Mangrovicoccus ximenensis]|uniref:GlxA family transcriptional regulator n=1 Tax=Mangrovicoccus ximenensis TaxID=1911570 RepID=UPI0038B26CCE